MTTSGRGPATRGSRRESRWVARCTFRLLRAGVFWIFAAICVASFVFSYRLAPETKGRTLEEIGRSWLSKAPHAPAERAASR